jgi:hypothetical protein
VAGRVFFYVGMRKTGTRWFIYEFFPRLAGLRVLRIPRTARLEDMTSELKSDLPTLVVCHDTWIGNLSTTQAPDGGRRLDETLGLIGKVAPDAGIIIGFRENIAWLNSSYAQMAKKKAGLDATSFADSYSPEELSWSWTLHRIENSFGSVFPFLHNEMDSQPATLIDDLCGFLGVSPPEHATELIAVRKNQSPRTAQGQFAMRQINRLLRLSGNVGPADKGALWSLGERLGLWLDTYFPDSRIAVRPEVAAALREDWNKVIRMTGERRGRDLLEFALPLRKAEARAGTDVREAKPEVPDLRKAS